MLRINDKHNDELRNTYVSFMKEDHHLLAIAVVRLFCLTFSFKKTCPIETYLDPIDVLDSPPNNLLYLVTIMSPL